MRQARLTRSEGPYRQGQTVCDTDGVSGTIYVDPGRYDIWWAAGILDPVDNLEGLLKSELVEIAESQGVDHDGLLKDELVEAIRAAREVTDG